MSFNWRLLLAPEAVLDYVDLARGLSPRRHGSLAALLVTGRAALPGLPRAGRVAEAQRRHAGAVNSIASLGADRRRHRALASGGGRSAGGGGRRSRRGRQDDARRRGRRRARAHGAPHRRLLPRGAGDRRRRAADGAVLRLGSGCAAKRSSRRSVACEQPTAWTGARDPGRGGLVGCAGAERPRRPARCSCRRRSRCGSSACTVASATRSGTRSGSPSSGCTSASRPPDSFDLIVSGATSGGQDDTLITREPHRGLNLPGLRGRRTTPTVEPDPGHAGGGR